MLETDYIIDLRINFSDCNCYKSWINKFLESIATFNKLSRLVNYEINVSGMMTGAFLNSNDAIEFHDRKT